MQGLDKLKYFESLDIGAIVSNVLIYIDDKMKARQIYNLDDPLPYVNTAVEKLLDGKHAWDVKKDPDPTNLLRGNVWRAICHEIEKRNKNQDYKNFHHPVDIDPVLASLDGQISENVTSKYSYEADEVWGKIKQLAEKENEDAWYYLEALEEIAKKNNHTPKRAEIADYLEWDITKVTNIKRWVQRHTRHLLDQRNTEVIL